MRRHMTLTQQSSSSRALACGFFFPLWSRHTQMLAVHRLSDPLGQCLGSACQETAAYHLLTAHAFGSSHLGFGFLCLEHLASSWLHHDICSSQFFPLALNFQKRFIKWYQSDTRGSIQIHANAPPQRSNASTKTVITSLTRKQNHETVYECFTSCSDLLQKLKRPVFWSQDKSSLSSSHHTTEHSSEGDKRPLLASFRGHGFGGLTFHLLLITCQKQKDHECPDALCIQELLRKRGDKEDTVVS